MLNEKGAIICLLVGQIKIINERTFSITEFLRKVKVELYLSNYITKTDLTEIDTSSFAKKVDLASLKSNVAKLDIDKLKKVPTNLR